MKSTRWIIFLLVGFQCADAQHIAKYAGEFLSIGVGGRALGLGGAYAALGRDASAGYWNPAALGYINYPEIILMHDERFGGMENYDFGAVAIPYGTDATIGLSVIRLGVDENPNTLNAWEDRNNNGVYDTGDDINPDKITYFNYTDWAFYGSYSQRFSSNLFCGVNIKILRRNMQIASATGIGFDIGALYTLQENWFVAANIQDVTTTLLAWSTGTNELISPTLKLGTVYFLDLFDGRFAPTFDVDIRFENRRYASFF